MTAASRFASRWVIAGTFALVCGACAHRGPATSASAPAVVQVDSRVRLELASATTDRWSRRRQTLVGTVVAFDSATIDLRVRAGDPAIRVPTASVGAAYSSAGPRSRVRAATVGGLRSGAIGLVSGLIMAAFMSSDANTPGQVVIGRTAFGAALGIGIGLVAPGERWRRVSFPLAPARSTERTRPGAGLQPPL